MIPSTFSERLSTLLDEADQLYSEIRKLRQEAFAREDLDSVEHLADIPGELDRAEMFVEKMYGALESAETCAKRGGM